MDKWLKENTVFKDTHKGYDFLIKYLKNPGVSYYCGYAKIPKEHKYYNIHYMKIPIKVHRDLSFSQDIDGEWWIGWDYNHEGDGNEDLTDVIKDSCGVIMQLLEAEDSVGQ